MQRNWFRAIEKTNGSQKLFYKIKQNFAFDASTTCKKLSIWIYGFMNEIQKNFLPWEDWSISVVKYITENRIRVDIDAHRSSTLGGPTSYHLNFFDDHASGIGYLRFQQQKARHTSFLNVPTANLGWSHENCTELGIMQACKPKQHPYAQ